MAPNRGWAATGSGFLDVARYAGFDTADLKDAKILLDDLSGSL